jgi:hypothetical protein
LRSRKRAGLAVTQQYQCAVDEIERLLGVLVVALGLLGEVVDALFQAVEVGEHQLGFDGLDIGQRRDLAFDMGDVGVFKAPHHMRDRVDFADGGEKLVAEAFALRGATHQACDVDEGQPRRDDLRGLGDIRQLVEPGIRHRDLADIRLDGAERIIRRLRRCRLGQRVEQRRLADIGQADDTAFESHNTS